MSVYISPVGLSSAPVANQLSVMATYKEKLCQAFGVNSSNQPSATVTYTAGTATLQGTTVFVPITASIQLLSPSDCCKAIPQMFTERFMVAFQGRTTLPTSVSVVSAGTEQTTACVKNNSKAYGYLINDSITITIGAAAAAS